MALSLDQLRTLAIVERSASALSILGILTIIIPFCLSTQFRNPVHRLIFINAFYNLFDVLATMIALGGPEAGNHSTLCQFQAFLLQMFPLADVLWTLAMAVDVYLIVFRRYEAEDLRGLELRYVVGITTVVFVPAATFLFVHTKAKGWMYGSVTLWCAISPRWIMYRIIFYYGPIWLAIFIAMILYALVGIEILRQRRLFNCVVSEFVGLETIRSGAESVSPGHFVEIDLETSHDMPRSPKSQEVEATSSVSASSSNQKLNISVSTSRSKPELSISDNDALADAPRSRSPISFRQYIFMPLMFFIVLLATWVAPTTNRLISLINPHFVSYPLLLAVGSTGSLRGFWNGVVFVMLGMKERKRRERSNSRSNPEVV